MTKANEEFQSCAQVTASGIFPIDLDGAGHGLPTIKAHCNPQTDVTTIGENTIIQVEKCDSIGCFKKSINYEATTSHFETLIKEASTCKQSIRVDCLMAPLSVSIKYDEYQTNSSNNREYSQKYPANEFTCNVLSKTLCHLQQECQN